MGVGAVVVKQVVGYEGIYEVTDEGEVFRVARGSGTRPGRRLTPLISDKGYLYVRLHYRKTMRAARIHRLVAEAFLENPHGHPQVNHLDGIKTNNHVENLEWCTHEHNIAHAWKTGLLTQRKAVVATHPATGERLEFSSICEATRHGFGHSNISRCCKDERRTHKNYRWAFTDAC